MKTILLLSIAAFALSSCAGFSGDVTGQLPESLGGARVTIPVIISPAK